MHGAACDLGEFLIEFAEVPVLAACGIAVGAAGEFGVQEVFLEAPPCPADACLEVDQDVVKVDATL